MPETFLAKKLRTGIFYGLISNLIWSLTFIIPKVLTGFTSFEITIGRYLIYGLLSLVLYIFFERKTFCGYDYKIWLRAFAYAFAGNIGYFGFVVVGIKLAGAPISALITGILPITMAVYGNLLRREFPFSRLITPFILIMVGLVLVNWDPILWGGLSKDVLNYKLILGVLAVFFSVGLWTWYGVSNANFLKKNPQISSSSWSTLIGVNCLIMVLIFLLLSMSMGKGIINVDKIMQSGYNFFFFVIGSIILGVVVSWSANLIWYKAALLLPVTIAGQLIVTSTIFTLVFVYIIDARMPSWFEIIGIIMNIWGVLRGIRVTEKIQHQETMIVK